MDNYNQYLTGGQNNEDDYYAGRRLMTFEEWWEEYVASNSVTNDSYIDSEAAWEHQQKRIDELFKKIQKVQKSG